MEEKKLIRNTLIKDETKDEHKTRTTIFIVTGEEGSLTLEIKNVATNEIGNIGISIGMAIMEFHSKNKMKFCPTMIEYDKTRYKILEDKEYLYSHAMPKLFAEPIIFMYMGQQQDKVWWMLDTAYRTILKIESLKNII
jgi:hypothetical protein